MTEGQAPAANPQPEVVVDDSAATPSYANFCRVTATPEEVVLDFGLNPQPYATGRQDVKAAQRIVMSYFTVKRLAMVLGASLQQHEKAFGVLELDINRRASATVPPVPPAGPVVHSSPPEVIKLDR
ncbi:DUF3467 domain-containing protein [Aquisphaera giovannonii]|nr:DUF3467 domain-containing protein [Aquisphaera giovannonii]